MKKISYLLKAKTHVLKNKDEKVTSNYGKRTYILNNKTKTDFHSGIDLISAMKKQDYIIAFEAGKIYALRDKIKGFSSKYSAGNYVYIDHGNGYITKYMHMKLGSIKVKKNQTIKKGTILGFIGATGYATGNHLHFAIFKNGKSLNPKPYLLKEKNIIQPINKYTIGRYRVTASFLNVRKGAGTNYDKKMFAELSKNAKAQIMKINKKASNSLCKGVICDVSKVSGQWGKIPSGWISLKYCVKL